MTIKALLFDLDGVLVDAMAWHEEAFLAAVRVAGLALTAEEHRAAFAGLPTKQKLQRLVEQGKLPASKVAAVAAVKQALTQTYIEQRATPDRSRQYLLQHFKSAGYLLGCVTNCIKHTTTEVLTRTQLLPLLDIVVTNEDVKEPKPSKAPYLRACELLHLQPGETLAFEDHDLGVTAAYNAGCAVRQIHAFDELTIEVVWEAIQQANQQLKESTL